MAKIIISNNIFYGEYDNSASLVLSNVFFLNKGGGGFTAFML